MIKDIIKSETVADKSSVLEAAKLMKKKKARHLFVVDKSKKLKGVLSTVDIVNEVVAKNKDVDSVTVKEVMTTPVMSVDVKSDPEKALGVMNKVNLLTCPVTKQKKFVGIVTYQGLLKQILSGGKRKK